MLYYKKLKLLADTRKYLRDLMEESGWSLKKASEREGVIERTIRDALYRHGLKEEFFDRNPRNSQILDRKTLKFSDEEYVAKMSEEEKKEYENLISELTPKGYSIGQAKRRALKVMGLLDDTVRLVIENQQEARLYEKKVKEFSKTYNKSKSHKMAAKFVLWSRKNRFSYGNI